MSIGPGGDARITYPVLTLPSGAKPRSDRLETALDLSLLPLADLGRPGSGGLVGSGSQLAATLSRLLRRSRLVATAPSPEPARRFGAKCAGSGATEGPCRLRR